MATGIGCTSIYKYILHILCFFSWYFSIKLHLNILTSGIWKERLLVIGLPRHSNDGIWVFLFQSEKAQGIYPKILKTCFYTGEFTLVYPLFRSPCLAPCFTPCFAPCLAPCFAPCLTPCLAPLSHPPMSPPCLAACLTPYLGCVPTKMLQCKVSTTIWSHPLSRPPPCCPLSHCLSHPLFRL